MASGKSAISLFDQLNALDKLLSEFNKVNKDDVRAVVDSVAVIANSSFGVELARTVRRRGATLLSYRGTPDFKPQYKAFLEWADIDVFYSIYAKFGGAEEAILEHEREASHHLIVCAQSVGIDDYEFAYGALPAERVN